MACLPQFGNCPEGSTLSALIQSITVVAAGTPRLATHNLVSLCRSQHWLVQ
jgi:hypothetical protein